VSISKRYGLVIIILLITGYVVFFRVGRLHEVSALMPLERLPENIGEWKLAEHVYLKDKIVDMLGVDEYAEAVYTSPDNRVIDLYVSYFNVLKEGKQFHSPKNCLIGSGSYLISTDVIHIPLDKTYNNAPTSYMVLQKGEQRQFVLYWFQCRGRIMSSEYKERIHRILDAILKKRTDGAFIRIVCYGNGQTSQVAQKSLVEFAQELIPLLDQYIPAD